MNINVATVTGEYDAFNLEDSRVGAPKDPMPVFMTMRLDKALMGERQTMQNYRGGKGSVKYRRALEPTVFLTNWSYMDHLIVTPGASEGLHRHPRSARSTTCIERRWRGEGRTTRRPPSTKATAFRSVPQAHSVANTGAQDLELMIIGVATEKGKLADTVVVK